MFRYCSCENPDFVEYLVFSDEIESVFTTKGLEKTPTVELEQYVPPNEVGLRPFTAEETAMVETAMQRLADMVRLISIYRGG